jgi:hypothetical protein
MRTLRISSGIPMKTPAFLIIALAMSVSAFSQARRFG